MTDSWIKKKPMIGMIMGAISGVIIALGLGSILPWKPQSSPRSPSTTKDMATKMYKAADLQGFISQQGQYIKTHGFSNKILIVTFMYPHCQYMCPELASTMSNVSRILYDRNLQNKVKLITINMNPTKSNNAEESKYLKQYGYNRNWTQWLFLRGNKKLTKRVITKGFHVNYRKIYLDRNKNSIFDKIKNGYVINIYNSLAGRKKIRYRYNYNNPVILVGPDGYVRAMLPNGETVSSTVLINDVVSIMKDSRVDAHG